MYIYIYYMYMYIHIYIYTYKLQNPQTKHTSPLVAMSCRLLASCSWTARLGHHSWEITHESQNPWDNEENQRSKRTQPLYALVSKNAKWSKRYPKDIQRRYVSLGRVKAIACNRKVHSSLACKTTQSTYTSWIDGHACVLSWTLDHSYQAKCWGLDMLGDNGWGLLLRDPSSWQLTVLHALPSPKLGMWSPGTFAQGGEQKIRPQPNAKWG